MIVIPNDKVLGMMLVAVAPSLLEKWAQEADSYGHQCAGGSGLELGPDGKQYGKAYYDLAATLRLMSQKAPYKPEPEALSHVFFVLNGLVNGEEGMRAMPAGGGGEDERLRPLADGWYYLHGDDPDGKGPWRTRDEAVRLAEAEAGLLKLDAAAIQRALLAGHLSPMTEGERQAYADAPEFCLCGEVGDFFVTVGWDPEDGDWRCEAYLGDAAALVDLKDGTWERL